MGSGEGAGVSIRQTILLPTFVASALIPLSVACVLSMMTWGVFRASGEGAWFWTGAGLVASLVWYSGLGAVLISPLSRVAWSAVAIAFLLACLVVGLEPAPFRGGLAACAGSGVFGLTLAGTFLLFRWWWGIASHSTPWSVLTVVLCALTCSFEGIVVVVSGEAIKALADPKVWQRQLEPTKTPPPTAALQPSINSQSTPRIGAFADETPMSRWSECLEDLIRDESLQRRAREIADPDLVSLVMDAVCRRDEKSRLEDLESYFFRSVKNAAAKREAIRPNTCEVDDQLACPDDREGFVSDFEVRMQKDLICRLDPQEQALLNLHYIEGHTWAEVGARLEPPASESAVKKRFERIRRDLRGQWAQLCN